MFEHTGERRVVNIKLIASYLKVDSIHVQKHKADRQLPHLDFQTIDTQYHELADAESWPDPTDYEICYAIMSDIPGELHIPFFSKVVMKNAIKRLQAYGYKVTKKKVSIS